MKSNQTSFLTVVVSLIAAGSLSCIALSAQAEAITSKSYCTYVNVPVPEPIGDRPGHAVQVSSFTCRVQGGPMDGGTQNGSTIFEADGTSVAVLSSIGVARKPGSYVAYQITEGVNTVQLTGGKPTGVTGVGKGIWTLATGAAAALKGKPFSYTLKSAGYLQFEIEGTTE